MTDTPDAANLLAHLTGLPEHVVARIEAARHDTRRLYTHQECVKAWQRVAALEADLEALLTPAFVSLTPQQLANAREVWRTTPGVNHVREYVRRAWPQLAAACDDWRQEQP